MKKRTKIILVIAAILLIVFVFLYIKEKKKYEEEAANEDGSQVTDEDGVGTGTQTHIGLNTVQAPPSEIISTGAATTSFRNAADDTFLSLQAPAPYYVEAPTGNLNLQN